MAQACEGTLRAAAHSQAAAGEVERGRGAFLCVYGRKWGEKGAIKSAQKTFQFMRNKLQAKAHGESALSICCVTGPHPSSARKSRTQPIRISEHSLNRSQAKCTLKHKEPEAARLHHDGILHCHPAEWKQVRTAVRLKPKNGRWHFTTKYFQKDSQIESADTAFRSD